MTKDILADIRANEADPAELEHLLLSYFHRSTQPTNDTVIYGAEDKPALEAKFTSSGRPLSLTLGPSFSADDQKQLAALVVEQLLSPGPTKIGRAVMFAGVPTVGWFRYRDEFQIIPVPPEAPRPEFMIGDHPFLLEFAFPSSSNPGVNVLRRGKREREIELLLSLLLVPVIQGQSQLTSFHWVLGPLVDGNLASSFKQGGYSWPGATFESDAFSGVDGIPPLSETGTNAYYSQRGITLGQTLGLPSNMRESLDLAASLSEADGERFLRSCYWYLHSFKSWQISRSISFEALVSAIEALMPPDSTTEQCLTCGRPGGAGPTKRFADFVDRYVSEVPYVDRRRFYALRSAISHGGKLLHSDEISWGMGIQKSNQSSDMRLLTSIVRAALINWLHAPRRN